MRSTWVQTNTDGDECINELLEKPLAREYGLADLLARPRVEHGPLLAAYNGKMASANGAEGKVKTAIEAQ